MSLEGLIIGLLIIALYGVLLCVAVYILLLIAARFGLGLTPPIINLIWAAVGLVIIIMIVSLLFGWRPVLPFRADAVPVAGRTVAAIPTIAVAHLPG